jgi:hypothetical protein
MIQSMRMRWGWHIARMGRRGMHMLFDGKPEGKIPLGRTECRLVENNRIDFGNTGWGGMDCIGTSGRLL